jgi:tagatose 1,6-diphosphate aldolase
MTARSAGTRWRLRRLADATGRFAMVAVDQRPPIEQVARRARGEDTHRREDVSAIKRLLVEELGDLSTAVLADPLIAYPDAVDVLPSDRGLIVTLEHAVYDETPGGRRSSVIPDWTVGKISRMGGDGVKVLAWYRPDASPEVREHQERFVAEIGAACRRHDLPFVFKRFYRGHKHHSPEIKGTGLGLSIVRRTVEAHGGTIDLVSTPGVETRFTLRLPTV